MSVVFLVVFVTLVGGLAFGFAALDQFVMLGMRGHGVAMEARVRVNIGGATRRRPAPGMVVNEERVAGPHDARATPPPGAEKRAVGKQ